MTMLDPTVRQNLAAGMVIPACPLALTAERRLDERRQRALIRYYLAAGAGGVAVGVHTTQFAIRQHDLYRPVLALAAEELKNSSGTGRRAARIGGICGLRPQAIAEVETLRELGYDAGLLSLGALRDADESTLLEHCGAVSKTIPIIGFYLQPSVGGRALPFGFWRRFADIPNVIAIKIAPFNRYQTIDVIRAVAESGREDIALYTGNDDNIVLDLLTPFSFEVNGRRVERRIVGGLLGHWSVWTRSAVQLFARCREVSRRQEAIPQDLLRTSVEITDANAAFFDAANGYAGCIAGLHEVLRRQGLLTGRWCLDPAEDLSPGQLGEIERVYRAYPTLNDDAFVAENRDHWLRG